MVVSAFMVVVDDDEIEVCMWQWQQEAALWF